MTLTPYASRRLLGRGVFDREVEALVAQALSAGLELWCAYIEVNYFKNLNSVYGHEQANRVLRAIGEAIDRASRANGYARGFHFHGDEFGMLFLANGGPQAREVSKRLWDDIFNSPITLTLYHEGKPSRFEERCRPSSIRSRICLKYSSTSRVVWKNRCIGLASL